MRRLVITAAEENRIDRFIIRAYGTYSWNKIHILMYFNPTLSLLFFKAGMAVMVPDDREIKEITNYRGFYSLVRN